MPSPSRLRDSTEIVLPRSALDGLRSALESEVTVTIFQVGDDRIRIIGSPVEIKKASNFLARHGVSFP